jgi:hypothetical protein
MEKSRVALPKFKYNDSIWLRFKLDQTWILINKVEGLIALKTNILAYEDDIMCYNPNKNLEDYKDYSCDISNAQRMFTDMIGYRNNIHKELTKEEKEKIEKEKRRCEEFTIFDTKTQMKRGRWFADPLNQPEDITDPMENYKTALAILEDWKEGNKVKAFLNMKHTNPFIYFIANGICHGIPYGFFQIRVEEVKA